MYLVVELKSTRKVLFESHEEADEYLKLNNLYDQVESIKEIERHEYNALMREMVENIRLRKQRSII